MQLLECLFLLPSYSSNKVVTYGVRNLGSVESVFKVTDGTVGNPGTHTAANGYILCKS